MSRNRDMEIDRDKVRVAARKLDGTGLRVWLDRVRDETRGASRFVVASRLWRPTLVHTKYSGSPEGLQVPVSYGYFPVQSGHSFRHKPWRAELMKPQTKSSGAFVVLDWRRRIWGGARRSCPAGAGLRRVASRGSCSRVALAVSEPGGRFGGRSRRSSMRGLWHGSFKMNSTFNHFDSYGSVSARSTGEGHAAVPRGRRRGRTGRSARR